MEKKIINEAIEMTKWIPWKDILVPAPQEEVSTPYPKVEYKIIESPTMDKLVRDVNIHLENGWVCDGWVQVSNGTSTRFYQSMERWVVQGDFGPEPEMPSKNSKAGTMGPKPLYIPGLENEPDLYEDVEKDAA